MSIAILAIAIVLLVVVLFSYVIFSMIFKPAKDRDVDYMKLPKNPQYDAHKERSNALTRELASREFEEVWIKSFDGLKLFGRYYHVKDGAPLQIEFHGYHGFAYRDFCGGNKIARDAGHNTLLIDQRNHGKSEGRAITFGINERRDAKSWVEWAVERFGKDQKIILAGVSMGAANVLMASELDLSENVVGVIADCPYSSPVEIICKVSRERKIPVWLIYPFIFSAAAIFGHFNLGAATPIDAVRKAKLPILLIHGTADKYVPYDMSVRMKAANEKGVTFLTVPEAGHGLSYMVDSKAYENAVLEFCRKVL